jgi:23S rRNA pseudouridine2605 synthase
MGSTVDPDRDVVKVDGVLVEPDELFYIVLNKPKACITTVSDPEGRPTVMDYVFGLPASVVPVGRLDYYSEGVLLLTNDGDLSSALLSPKRNVEKTYHVKIRGRVRPAHLRAMREGVKLEDGHVTKPAQVDLLKTAKSVHDWVVITLNEGKSRQIHRMAEALGYQVLKLQRVAFAGITFYGLRVGDARELTQDEVESLYEIADIPRARRARGRGEWRVRREQTDSARRIRGTLRESGGEKASNTKTPMKRTGPTRADGKPRAAPGRTDRKPAGRSGSRSEPRSGPRAGGRTAGPSKKTGGRSSARPGTRPAAPSKKPGGRAPATGGRKPARSRGPKR